MNENRARTRFVVIQLLRLIGVALVMAGLLILRGRLGFPPIAGYVALVVGLIDIFFVPVLLARRWRSDKK